MATSGLQRRKIEVLLDKVDQLPTLPGVARHLLPLLVEERLNRRDIQFAIEVDGTLAARALRLAVSLGHPADSLRSVDDLMAAIPTDVLMADLLSIETLDEPTLHELGLSRLWRHVLATGMAAQIIAGRLGTVRPAEALMAGILHDIGQIALATLMPRAYNQVIQRAAAGETDLVEAEREILSIDHSALGRRLAARWGFSERLQNVIWLHHQPQIPADTAGALLVQVVRLADLVVRSHGFSFNPAEKAAENLAESAERLGLSGAGVDLIGHQVVSAFDLNARQVGLSDDPGMVDLWPAVSAANARLGRLFRAEHAQTDHLQAQARRADLLVRFNSRIASCRGATDVLEAAAATAHESLGIRVAVTYFLGREGDYVEGIRCNADGSPLEHILYPLEAKREMEGLLPSQTADCPVSAIPMRAEQAESWLFERLGAALGSGPFYTVAMCVEGRKVGGLVFALPSGRTELTPGEIGELAALTAAAGVALKRVLAEADLVALTEELAEANRKLQAAQDEQLRRRNVSSLGEMAAGAAHEINNPLAIISGRAQQLLTGERDPARQDILKTIVAQADRISGIIRELRAFACPATPALNTVDAVALAREVAGAFQPRLAEGGPTLHVDAAPAQALIRVDPKQVAGAMEEFITNAAEACSGGRGSRIRLAVQAEPADATVRITVADDGPGMDPAVRAHAFDPLFCGHQAGRRRGLGLSKAYRTVQANNGRLTLESTPGAGTTVRMTFQAALQNA
jgi:signal transduction histidine kinase/HD-like signal output (HDOD) protein